MIWLEIVYGLKWHCMIEINTRYNTRKTPLHAKRVSEVFQPKLTLEKHPIGLFMCFQERKYEHTLPSKTATQRKA